MFDGKVFFSLKESTSPCWPVRNLMTWKDSFWCLLCFGIARNEPPQLPPLPGMVVTFHLPLAASPASPEMTPRNHAGAKFVAQAPFLNPAVQSSLHRTVFAVRPSLAHLRPRSQAALY